MKSEIRITKEIRVRDLRQNRRFEIVNGSKLNSSAGIGRMTCRGHSRCAGRWTVSPHSSPLPEGEGQGEGKPQPVYPHEDPC